MLGLCLFQTYFMKLDRLYGDFPKVKDGHYYYPEELIASLADDKLHRVISKMAAPMTAIHGDPKFGKYFKYLDQAMNLVGEVTLQLKPKRG
jgi:hypothetical protein